MALPLCSLWNLRVLSLLLVAVALSPPRYLSFSELSHASVRVSWDVASPAVKSHRVTYVSSRGSNPGEVSPQRAGGRKINLGASDTTLFSFSCVVQGGLICWQCFNSEKVTFDAVATHVLTPLQLSPCSSPNSHTTSPLQVEVPGTATSTVLRPLSSLTQYFISVRSTYDEGDSFPITGNVTTCK